jgi:uncharacterized membrane protein
MIDDLLFVLTVVSALGCGLIGGVFFAFSSFVMKALARLPSAQGIAAMQSINVVVINPLFMVALFGTGLGCAVVGVGSVLRWQGAGGVYVFVGSVLYLVGTVGVTVVFNVPRNDALAGVGADTAEGAELWVRYVAGWTAWNHVRTVAGLGAGALLIIGLCC